MSTEQNESLEFETREESDFTTRNLVGRDNSHRDLPQIDNSSTQRSARRRTKLTTLEERKQLARRQIGLIDRVVVEIEREFDKKVNKADDQNLSKVIDDMTLCEGVRPPSKMIRMDDGGRRVSNEDVTPEEKERINFEIYYHKQIKILLGSHILNQSSGFEDCKALIRADKGIVADRQFEILGARSENIYNRLKMLSRQDTAATNLEVAFQDMGVNAIRVAVIFDPEFEKILVRSTGERWTLPIIIMNPDTTVTIQGADQAAFLEKFSTQSCHREVYPSHTYLAHAFFAVTWNPPSNSVLS